MSIMSIFSICKYHFTVLESRYGQISRRELSVFFSKLGTPVMATKNGPRILTWIHVFVSCSRIPHPTNSSNFQFSVCVFPSAWRDLFWTLCWWFGRFSISSWNSISVAVVLVCCSLSRLLSSLHVQIESLNLFRTLHKLNFE